MKHVKMTLCNIQSHEYTVIEFSPGLTFIASEENNVGKSTIFKVLQILPVASTVSPDKLSDLLRIGESKGYAMFEFDSMRVILWLLRQDNNKVVPIFQTEADGEVVQTSKCPPELLNALDIVYHSPTESVLNIIEADKVQLIVDEGKESDSIISSILIDYDVEQAKENLTKFHQKLYNDDKNFYAQYEIVDSDLRELSYNMGAESYFEELHCLERIAEILDKGVVSFDSTYIDIDTTPLSACLSVMEKLKAFLDCEWDYTPKIDIPAEILATMQRAFVVSDNLSNIEFIPSTPVTVERVSKMLRASGILDNLYKASFSVRAVSRSLDEEHKLLHDISSIREVLYSEAEIVQCPVKGKVVFADEECVSIGD